METVDQHRGILHGGNSGKVYYDDAFMIDLLDKVSGKLQIVLQHLLRLLLRNGFASISFLSHPLDLLTECAD